jgi:hypothetical protein
MHAVSQRCSKHCVHQDRRHHQYQRALKNSGCGPPRPNRPSPPGGGGGPPCGPETGGAGDVCGTHAVRRPVAASHGAEA